MNCYIHIPFCRGKCGYCAFYSEAGAAPQEIAAYLRRLENAVSAMTVDEPLRTIYLGGGTPTLLDLPQLEKLFDIIFRFDRTDDCEISIEANPETLTREKLDLLKRRGVNRISCGVQSFDPHLRSVLGRQCGQTALERALELIGETGFPHWNIDLIYAIPGQTPKAWERDLRRAVEYGIDHLSCYNLTREEGARLSDLAPTSDDLAVEMWHLARKILAEFGFERYEISNYARPGGQCRHNVSVWRGGRLLGLGPAAAGFDGRNRYTHPASLSQWLTGVAAETDELPRSRRLNEIFAVNLRTAAGWTPDWWQQVPQADAWSERLGAAMQLQQRFGAKYVSVTPDEIKLSERGLLFWNSIAESLL